MKYFLLLSVICLSLHASDRGILFKGQLLNLNSTKFKATTLGVHVDFFEQKEVLDGKIFARAYAGVWAETGTSSSTYSDFNEFKENNGIMLHEVLISWRPVSFFELSGGAINQSIHKSKIFLDNIPFLSLLEKFKVENKNWRLKLDLQQSLPKNSNLSSRFGTIDEGSPLFFSEKITGSLLLNSIDVDLSIQHFAFDKLSRAVAYKSLFMGNSTAGSGSTGTIFRYSYIGWEGGLALRLKKIRTEFIYNFVVNESAPSGSNSGHVFTGSWMTNFGKFDLRIGGDLFYNEADTMPGYYTDKYYGHQNRRGFSLFSSINVPKLGTLSIKFTNAERIDFHPFQVDERIAYMSFQGRIL